MLGLKFYPLFSEYEVAKSAARSLDSYCVTGYIFSEKLSREQIFDLQAVLSFIEHIDVRISSGILLKEPTVGRPEFDLTPFPGPRFSGGGAVISTDNFCRNSRKEFIALALPMLLENSSRQSKFRLLFFKKIETFRRQPFIEITYFLLFSGLESYSRYSIPENNFRSASEAIYKVMKGYGFNVFQDKATDLRRSIATYAHIRNALFHEGELVKTLNVNGGKIKIDSANYLFSFSMLVSLLVMKIVKFDDGHTNWDCWIDRQLYK
ncbi:hypothetical protein [Pseudomonas citronellolis]|uniref:hypothetical protein n=1 Tax=Pseudomonas citronellolis TaxID=53408 RepID=UPI00248E788D|nr:hypothetical protein [Pseudomonas citronellolis]